MPPPAIALEDVTASRGGRAALYRVSLTFAPGVVTALVGPSGAGKSTVLRCCVRLEEPAYGRVVVGGADVTTVDPRELRRRVALVAQAPVMLPGDVRSNLAYGLPAGVPDAPLVEALRAAGLEPAFLDRDARGLSGGEAARVAIARALAREAAALLLDEPTAALDHRAAAGVEALIVRLAARGLTVGLVTHDERQAARVASRAVRLGRRGVEAEGAAAEVLGR